MARAYDTWDSYDQKNFNPDGSMKPEYRQRLLDKGISSSNVDSVEEQKMNEVERFEKREKLYMKRYGIPYSEWVKQGSKISQSELEERQRKAIRNGEEISTLPMAIDPDEYYEQLGNAGLF